MARTNATNFSGGLQFPYATAGTDLFKKEDVQTLALAVDGHDHSTGKGLPLAASAISTGLITSAMIADGTIVAGDITNSTITTAKLAANAVTLDSAAVSSAAESTTSGSLVALTAPKVTLTTTGGSILVWFHGSFNSTGSPGASINTFGVRIDAGAWNSMADLYTPGTNYHFTAAFVFDIGVFGAGSHTIEIGWSSSAGTLSTSTGTLRSLTVVELKR